MAKPYVWDTEGNGLLDTISKIHCGVFKSLDGKETVSFKPTQIKDMFMFMDEEVECVIGHNILGYDLPVLKKLYGYEFKGRKIDTLIMSRLLNPKRRIPPNAQDQRAGPHSLYAWGVRVGVDKPEHNDWENFSPEMLIRCERDTEINRLAYKLLLEEMESGDWENAFKLTFKLFENLQDQEAYGWLVDKDYMLKCIHQLDTWIRRIDAVIAPKLPLKLEIQEIKDNGEYKYIKKPFLKSGDYSESTKKWMASSGLNADERPVIGCYSRINFRTVDLNSNAETKEFLLQGGWEPMEWNTNERGERTSPKISQLDPFEGIEGRLGKLVARRIQCRQRRGIISGLIECIRPDGRIPSAIASIAVTGRLTHRNIVNIPAAKSFFGKQMRSMFICEEGKVLVGCDSDSCQIRMLAGRMNDPKYTDTILNGMREDGTDMHTVNQLAAGLDTRDNAKTFFYGFLFGAGDAKIGKIVRGNAQRGRQLKEQFMQGLPALGVLINKLQEEWRKSAKKKYNPQFSRMEYQDGQITGLDGRPVTVPSEHQVLVYCLQSDEAVMMAAAYNYANKKLREKYKYGEDFGFVTYMHDEFQIECREEIAEDVGKIVANSIEWAGRFYKIPCPHKGDYTIGKNWYLTH